MILTVIRQSNIALLGNIDNALQITSRHKKTVRMIRTVV